MPIELWPLPIFPEGALSSSVTTCVLIGVAVTAFFNLRFGWVLSGLVVPGYVVPLLIAKPWAAVAIYVEAVATYCLVRLLSEFLSRTGLWSSFFGRDRFFALILASVLARMVFDLWLLPEFGAYLTNVWGFRIDYRNELHSFGLVVVALTANQLWKPGLLRGSAYLAVTLACTFLIVRFGLMEVTNFTISNLKYVYEDIAGSIQAAPKAYIILISTAFVASRMNLRYGWDFNGILVPSLLALQWYQPWTILASFVEAFVILGASTALMRAPFFSNLNLEGARKLVFFFSVGFVYKIILAHLISIFTPDIKATDVYGYGYLLSTLMALKMHEHEIPVRLTRTTLQASITSIALATAAGLLLTGIPPFRVTTPGNAERIASRIIEAPGESLATWLTRDRVRLYGAAEGRPVASALPGEIAAFTRGVAGILEGTQGSLREAARDLSEANYRLVRISDSSYYLRERTPIHGWGFYAIDVAAGTGLLLEAPLPVDEPGTFEAATALFQGLDAHALAIAGSRRNVSGSPAADVLRAPSTIFQAFHLQLARNNAIQLRSHPASRSKAGAPATRPALYITQRIPEELDLQLLAELLDDLDLNWGRSGGENRQREARRGGFAELFLSTSDIRTLSARAYVAAGDVGQIARPEEVVANLEAWLFAEKSGIARRDSESYVPPRDEELLYIDEAILPALFDWATHPTGRGARGDGAREGRHPLDGVASAARAVGYRIVLLSDPETKSRYVILTEGGGSGERRNWGTHVFRVGPAAPYVIQVPRPLLDRNSYESATALFGRLKARALLSAGAHAFANADGSADLVSADNSRNLLNLIVQALLRNTHDEPGLVLQVRAFAARDGKSLPDADVLVSIAGEGVNQSPRQLPARWLLDVLETDGMAVRIVRGERETAGYEVGVSAPSLYSTLWPQKDFAILWMSPGTRRTYRQQGSNKGEAAKFRALGIPTDTGSLTRRVRASLDERGLPPVPGRLADALDAYIATRDIVALRRAQSTAPHLNIERFVDSRSQQAFALVLDENGSLRGISNLAPRSPDSRASLDPELGVAASLDRFVAGRIAWLSLGRPE